MAITAAELLVKVGWDDSDVEKGSKNTSDKVGRTTDLLKTGAVALGGAAVAGGGLAVTSFMNVQDALAPIGTLLGFQSDEYNKYTENVKKLIAASPQSADEIGRGAYDVLSAGIMDVDAATIALNESQKLAAAGLGQVPDAVDVITSSMNAFKSENLSGADAARILFGTMSIGKADLNGIAQGFGGIAPMAAQAGVSFQEMMASVAAMTQTGLPASEVYTGLKATLSNVIKPTAEAAKVAKDLGLDFSTAAIESKGFSGFLDDVKAKTGGSTDTMAKLFGSVEALNLVMALTGDQAGTFKESIDGVVTSGEGLDDAAKGINNTLSNQFATMKNRSMVALSELATKGFGMLSEFWSKHGATIIAVKDKLVTGFSNMWDAFRTGMTQNEAATPFERIGLVARQVVGIIQQSWPAIVGVVTTVITTIKGVIEAAAPTIVLVFETIKTVVGDVVEFIASKWPQIATVLQGVADLVGPIIELIIAIVQRAVQIIAFLWRNFGDELLAIVGFAFDHIVPIINGALQIIQGVIRTVTAIIKGDWGAAWDGIKMIVSGVWDTIKGIISLAWDTIWFLLSNGMSVAKGLLEGGWNLIVGFFSGAIDGFKGMFTGMFDGIWDAFRWAINQVIGGWNSLQFKIPGFDPPGPGPSFGGFTLGVPQIPYLAMGGNIKEGGLFRVGERGPETLFLPAGSAVQSNGAPFGGGSTINIYMAPGSDGDDVVRALNKWQRRNGPVPISVSG